MRHIKSTGRRKNDSTLIYIVKRLIWLINQDHKLGFFSIACTTLIVFTAIKAVENVWLNGNPTAIAAFLGTGGLTGILSNLRKKA